MKYIDQFFDTCYGEEATTLAYLVGAALYHDENILGKIIVLIGPHRSGKSSFLQYLWEFAKYDDQILFTHDTDVDRDFSNGRYDFEPNIKKIRFVGTNREPQTDSDRIIKIHTTGERMPIEDWKKYCIEMNYFHDALFKDCMNYYICKQKLKENKYDH